ncbi:MAG: hypothetical protein JNK05_31515 [Myxococcales bacterium]|nr:hypothetical protein [Myxococcales bacterium]
MTRALLVALSLVASSLAGLRECSLPEGLSAGGEDEAPAQRGRRRRRRGQEPPAQPAQPWAQPVVAPQPGPTPGPSVAPTQPSTNNGTPNSGARVGARRLPFSDAERLTEVNRTLDLIAAGGPFPFRQDGVVFHNREGRLPDAPFGTYHEYTVVTPGLTHRGPRRIITGTPPSTWYTDDHYRSFVVIDPRRY